MSYSYSSIQKTISVKDKLRRFTKKSKIKVSFYAVVSLLIQQSAFCSDGNGEKREEASRHLRPQVEVDLQLHPHLRAHSGPGPFPHLQLNPELHIRVTLPKDKHNDEKPNSLEPNKTPPQNTVPQDIPHLGAGPTPTVTSRINYLLKYQLGGWNSAVRNGYPSYQAAIFSGNLGGLRPLSRQEGFDWMTNVLKGLDNTGIFNKWRADRSLLIVGHEFAPNGAIVNVKRPDGEADTQKWEYNAKYPITVETYVGIREAVSQWLKDKPRGVGIILGGCAIDIRKITDDHGVERIIGENRGLVAFSGDTEILEFAKRFRDPADGWTEEYTVIQGGGPIEIPINKLVPDSKDSMAVSICRDAAKINAFPMESSIIVISGSGVPPADTIAASNLSSAKLIADMKQFADPLSDAQPYLSEKTGLYEFNNRKEFIQLFSAGLSFWSISPPQVQKCLESYRKVDQARFVFSYRPGAKGTLLITEPREIPTVMSQNRLDQAEKTMVEQQSPVAHQKNDPPKEASIADPVGESFKDQFEANKDHVDRALEDFGGERKEK